MLRIRSILSLALPVAVASCLSACGQADRSDATYADLQSGNAGGAPPMELSRPANTKLVRAEKLVRKLESAGLHVEELGAAQIDMDVRSRFSEEPRSTVVLRIADGDGNSAPMTFLEFGSWKAAAELDAKPVNGFAVRNWFVLGTTSTYFVVRVREALAN
ncbi:hypothetical protein K8I85_09155 [bacterium]|nr:hypothetical protein [bacterium]